MYIVLFTQSRYFTKLVVFLRSEWEFGSKLVCVSSPWNIGVTVIVDECRVRSGKNSAVRGELSSAEGR